ncbi:hypothetical protein [Streptomyces sp. NPDC059063]|uniref:hypothetical protein n=1 Tax=unclassified Streptomyces TaxID=2593676 RepID=UPI0036C62FC5
MSQAPPPARLAARGDKGPYPPFVATLVRLRMVRPLEKYIRFVFTKCDVPTGGVRESAPAPSARPAPPARSNWPAPPTDPR